MDVISNGPLRVASIVWQPRSGAWALTVVCRATYRLEPIESPLVEPQEDPAADDGYWDDDEAKSLYAPSDLVPFKARADVLLLGHAFAPERLPVRSVLARLVVGEVNKGVEIWCDRVFGQDGQLLEGPHFAKMPLRYERAAGGPATWNPVGMRFDAAPDSYGAVPIPNLQPPGIRVSRRGDTFAPIGFGAIAPTWPGRVEKIRRHPASFSYRGWSEQGMPEDLDPSYFNSAPPDQQVDAIRPDERIVLENLHPEHSRLVTRLPGVRPTARVTAGGRMGEEVMLSGDTLWIDTDRGIATVVWRGRVALSEPGEAGCVVVSIEGVEERMRLGGGEIDGRATIGLVLRAGGREEALPVVQPLARRTTIVGTNKGGCTLPFVAAPSLANGVRRQEAELAVASSPWAVVRAGAPTSVESLGSDGTRTLDCAPLVVREALPFISGGPGMATAGAVLLADSSEFDRGVAAGWGAASVTPFEASPGMRDMLEGVDALEEGAEDERAPTLPPPPAMIGPLATVDTGAFQDAASEPSAPGRADPAATTTLAKASQVETELPLADFPIERCAAIAASIARRRAETAQILEANKLEPAVWAALDQHWNEAIREETGRGKIGLLRGYDEAYLARLEQERGPIQVEEYARLVVAAERENVREVLAELTLPRGAMMRIERVWIGKIAGDARLGKIMRNAVKTAREE